MCALDFQSCQFIREMKDITCQINLIRLWSYAKKRNKMDLNLSDNERYNTCAVIYPLNEYSTSSQTQIARKVDISMSYLCKA